MACVRKRRGMWVADYRDHSGKRHWETFETRKEAEQELAKHVHRAQGRPLHAGQRQAHRAGRLRILVAPLGRGL